MKQKLLTLALLLTFAVEALPQALIAHPWQGKRVAYFGDSITDPRNNGSKKKYWGFLEDWLGITPYVYGVSGRQWNDIPRQTDQLKQEHGQDFDAILIFCGTNDYNNGVPLGQWWDERSTEVMYGHGQVKQLVKRRQRTPSMDPTTFKGTSVASISTSTSRPSRRPPTSGPCPSSTGTPPADSSRCYKPTASTSITPRPTCCTLTTRATSAWPAR